MCNHPYPNAQETEKRSKENDQRKTWKEIHSYY